MAFLGAWEPCKLVIHGTMGRPKHVFAWFVTGVGLRVAGYGPAVREADVRASLRVDVGDEVTAGLQMLQVHECEKQLAESLSLLET